MSQPGADCNDLDVAQRKHLQLCTGYCYEVLTGSRL
jgi:hypothetical protein